MRDDTPSRTAWRVALRRALHQLVDRPVVFDDPVAAAIIGAEGRAEVDAQRRAPESVTARYLRAFLVARSRFAEDCLAAAIARGARRYIVLGAGLDTFAYRNPFPGLHVVEVDYPATQQWKRRLLREASIAVPDTVSYLPIDFDHEDLGARLEEVADPAAVTVFAWLGVSMYLARETVVDVLRTIGTRYPSGSAVVFDYAVAPETLGWMARAVRRRMADRVAAAGEPWRSHFTPEALAAELARAGFGTVTDLDGDAVNARYFADRDDGLRGGSLARLVEARI